MNQLIVEETVTSRKADIKSLTLIQKNTIGICCCHLSILSVLFLPSPPLFTGWKGVSKLIREMSEMLSAVFEPPPPHNTIVQIHNARKEIK